MYTHYDDVGRYTEMIILYGFFRSFVLFFFPLFFCFSPIIAAVPPLMISCSTKGMLYYIHVLIIRITTIIIVSDRFRKPKLLSITSAYIHIHTHIISIRACTHTAAHTHIILHRISGRIYTTCMCIHIYIYDMCTYMILRSRCICARKIICARRVRRVRNNIFILRARVKVFPRRTTIINIYKTSMFYEKNLFSTIDRCVYDDDDDYHDDLRH